MHKELQVKLTGKSPLLMHNIRLADPFEEIAQQIASIAAKGKHKTTDDIMLLSELEFKGGLYMDENGPCVPGECLEGMIVDGAKKYRKGQFARSGVFVNGNSSLEYPGPRDIEGLWMDKRFIDRRAISIKGSSKVMRTRPTFTVWSLTFVAEYLPDVLNLESLKLFIETAGNICGLMDYRPKFGRFNVEFV